MSFNIRYGTADDGDHHWRLRQDLVFSVFERHDPAIVGLQEALKFQLDTLLLKFPEYAFTGVGRDDGDTLGEYSALFYNKDQFILKDSGTFWFSETPNTVASKSWGNHIPRICTWVELGTKNSGRRFAVYNLHLDHQSQPSREKSVELLMDRLSQQTIPTIVMGDFNAGETNPAIQYLTTFSPKPSKGFPLQDTFRVLFPDAYPVGTFNGFKGKRDGEKIDYIFTTRDITVTEAAIVYDHDGKRYPSDHYPVIATLRLP